MLVEILLGAAVILIAVVLMLVIMLQSNNDSKMSGTITGSAETFFGQSKADTRDRKLSRWTIILSAVFGVLVVVMYALVGQFA